MRHAFETLGSAIAIHTGRFYLAYAGIFLIVSAVVPPLNDYRAYLLQWSAVAHGQDPWLTPISLGINAYGPLHNLYGLLSVLDARLPRLLGSGLWLLAVWMIVSRIRASNRRLLLFAMLMLNPFFWGWVAVFGSNDAIVAAFVIFAVIALSKRASVVCGICIALAALLKFYPLLVVPYVAVHRRRINWPFALTAVGLFVAGMAMATAIWGPSTMMPLLFASGREPSQLSLQAFLATSALSPIQGTGIPTHLSKVIFVAAELILFGFHVWRRGSQLEGLLLGLLATLTFYQLGHFQFYLPLMLVIPLYIASNVTPPSVSFRLMILFAMISFFATCYLAFDGLVTPPWLHLRQNAGLPTFVVEIAIIAAMLKAPSEKPC